MNSQRKSAKASNERSFRSSQKGRMFKKMLYYGYQMGYDQPIDEAQKMLPNHEVNLQNVSTWCTSDKCSISKPLKAMTAKELNKALSQFEQVYKSYLKRV